MQRKKNESSVNRRHFFKQTAALTAAGVIGNAALNGVSDFTGNAVFAQQNKNFTPTGG
ncbi:MAG: twin-arginine translocation signal domain-containing protein, partial [Thermoguttaceae bacterium]